MDTDFIQAPSGLLSLAAQALNEGHDVTVLNLSNACWQKVETSIRRRPAALFGLSCVTPNRRGVFMTARFIRRTFPAASVIVGGPHVTALPVETLDRCSAVDAVVIGEGEDTFMEIVEALRAEKPLRAIAGTAWRENGRPVIGPARAPIEDLDRIVPPIRYFPMRKLLTSRGCPGSCTFCCSSLMWGHLPRFHSVHYVLDMIEEAVRGHRQKIVSFKDDTFTANRRRVISICNAIRKRKLNFVWSCETRADCLDEEVLRAMRLAGCQRISIGVESASDRILENIKKRISPAKVARATRSAQKFGIRVRYYMMVGNRGETRETFQQSLDFLRTARPNQFVFTQLHLYPGTEEFDIFRRSGVVSSDIYFDRDFASLTCFAGKQADADSIYSVLRGMEGIQQQWEPGVEDCRQMLTETGDLPAARMDLASALILEGDLREAEHEVQAARQDGYCLPGRVYNNLACIAAGRCNLRAAGAYLEKAMACHPHQVVVDNMIRLSAETEENGGPHAPVRLDPRIPFETTFLRQSPEFPDPDPVLDTTLERS
jgi:radical SAM superfamily enzyme YgiQ (UPF0313 family)